MTIAIIGAGTLGTTLAAEFSRRGLESRVISRSEHHAPLPPGVEYVRADAREAARLAHAIAGATVVLQTSQPAYTRWIQEFPLLQAAVLAAAEKAGSRLVLADNLYAYGGGDRGVITDATPETPCSTKGQLRKAMAEDALAAHRAGRVQVALTRPSNYIGAAYPFTRRLLTDRARAGKPMQVLGVWTSRTRSATCQTSPAQWPMSRSLTTRTVAHGFFPPQDQSRSATCVTRCGPRRVSPERQRSKPSGDSP